MDIATFLEGFNARDPQAVVAGVTWSGDDVVLEIDVFEIDEAATDMPSETSSRIRIICQDVAEVHVSLSGFLAAEWSGDHPALLKHNQPQGTLYFSSAPADPDALIGRLWQVNQDIYRGYRSMADDFNISGYGLAALLAGGHGELASGPMPVLTRYADAIGETMTTNLVATGTAPRGGYHLLDFHADCYVICCSASVTAADAALIEPQTQ
jgi:hypothetical protein